MQDQEGTIRQTIAALHNSIVYHPERGQETIGKILVLVYSLGESVTIEQDHYTYPFHKAKQFVLEGIL